MGGRLRKVAEQTDGDALARCAAGDRSAFGEIVREHQAMVYSLALHFLRSPSMAEDLAQDVFLELYRNVGRIQSGEHLRFWLRKVTCHRSIDRVRRREPNGVLSLDDVPEPAVAAQSRDPLLEARLWKLVATLPDKPRMAVILRYQEEMELREIAEVMEIPINTVKSSIERALELLRTKLARSMGGVKV
ncbi:MAG TPA: sigma-70 family RNA polymerase sigma factor [Terriglobia bacterium]|nr:sigma-70 family RNA polymerase sigma factor [Terriglobia bacterium]HEX5433798.1 sigma-70 family RNA polymerase sigma factor [Candidatus Angelobacter sp.]